MDYWLTMVSDNIFKHICDGGSWSYDMFSDGLTIETTNQQQAVLGKQVRCIPTEVGQQMQTVHMAGKTDIRTILKKKKTYYV